MKRLMISMVVVGLAFASLASTFDEYVRAKDYVKAAKVMNVKRVGASLSKLTLEDAAALYDAGWAITNQLAAQLAASIALQKGDNSKMLDFLGRDELKTITIFLLAYIDLNNEFAHRPYKNYKGIEMQEDLSLNSLYPDMMLAFYKRRAAKGDYDNAALIFIQAQMSSENPGGFANHITDEWKNFIASTFNPTIVENFKSGIYVFSALRYYNMLDKMNGDNVDTIASQYCTEKAFDALINSNYSMIPVASCQDEYKRLLLAKGKTAIIRVDAAKWLDKKANNKTASKSLYPWILENAPFGVAADFALYTKDVDFILDVWSKKLDTTATAQQIDSVLPTLNALDAGYRSNDFKTILLNINKKYTLKLYDDRDTWEPVISKIRAMIDTL